MDNELLQLNETINKDIADKKLAATQPPATETAATTTATTEVPSTVDWKTVSDDELKKILAERKITTTAEAPKVKTPDEIERENEARELSIIKYGVEKLGKKKEELLRPSELKNKKTEDLVWEDFVAEQKSGGKNPSDETILKRFKKTYNIPDEDNGIDYDEDEIAYGKLSMEGKKNFILERATKPLNEAKEKWEKEESSYAQAKEVEKQVADITKNKTYAFEIGGYKMDYTLTDEQNSLLQKKLAESMFLAKTNYAGQDIDWTKQATFLAQSDTINDVVTQIVKRESDNAVAKALEPFGNPVKFNSASTANGTTLEQKVAASMQNLPNMK